MNDILNKEKKMPRVNKVEHAQKDYPQYGIKKGDTYYWWKFRFGGKHVSLTPPKQSQLTQSDFLSTVYGIQEDLEGLTADEDDIQSFIDDAISQLEELRDECDDKRNNMPEQLQDSDTGTLLQERYDNLDEMVNELQGIDLDEWEEVDDDSVIEDLGDKEDDETQDEYNVRVSERKEEMTREKRDEILEQIWNVSYQGS